MIPFYILTGLIGAHFFFSLSTITFNPEDDSTPISNIVGWSDGSIVHVEFTAYEDYDEGNHYYNRATGSHLELVE